MKKVVFLSLVVFYFFNSINAQEIDSFSNEFEATWSDKFVLPAKYNSITPFDHSEDRISILTSNSKDKRMMLYNFEASTLDSKAKKMINCSNFPYPYETKFTNRIDNKYYVFYGARDIKSNEAFLYARQIDFDKKTIEAKGTLIFKSEEVGLIPNVTNENEFILYDKWVVQRISPDSSKILIVYKKNAQSKNDSKNYDTYITSVLDNELNEIWRKESKMPYLESQLYIEDFKIDNDGNVYFCSEVKELGEKGKARYAIDGKPSYHYEILKYSSDSESPQITKISIGEKFINEIRFKQVSDGGFTIIGYYSSICKRCPLQGVVTGKVTRDGVVSDMDNGYHEFPLELIKQNTSLEFQNKMDKKNETNEAGIRNLKIKNVTEEKNGDLLVIGEVFRTVPAGESLASHFDDIMVVKIDKEGTLNWIRKIPKRQREVAADGEGGVPAKFSSSVTKGAREFNRGGDGEISFKYFSIEDNSYFIFLDDIGNFTPKENEFPPLYSWGESGVLAVVKIDDKGNVSKKMILKTQRREDRFRPTDFTQVDDNTLVVRSYWGLLDGRSNGGMSAASTDCKLLKLTYKP